MTGEEAPGKSLHATLEDGFDDETPVWAAQTIMTYWVGRISQYMHSGTRNPDEMEGEADILREHRRIDHQLTKLAMNIPRHLSASQNLHRPWLVHMNVMYHGCILSLQHATMCKLFKKSTDANLMGPLKTRIYLAAEEIVAIVKLIAHFPGTSVSICTFKLTLPVD